MYSVILHGRRRSVIELQKCLYLINPFQKVSAFSNPFSSASAGLDLSSRDGLKGKTFTVSYLVGSLGLTRKLAESVSRKLKFEEKGNADSVLSLLRSHGFTDFQISNIITDYPRLLVLDAEKTIGPKLKFLLSREGVSTSELTEVLSKVPKIFGMKGDKTISIYYDFAKEIIEADKSSEFVKLSCLPVEGSKQGNKMRNVLVLRELGVPQKKLFSLICNSRVCCGKEERFEESVKKVVEMGFDPTTSRFVEALQAFHDIGEKKTMEERVNVYRKLGFDVEDVWEMFRKHPLVLNVLEEKILNSVETFLELGFSRDEYVMIAKRFPPCIKLSAESVKKKTEFLVKQMNWPLQAVVSNPNVLGLSMEKRIVPRCNIIKTLFSKGLLGKEISPISSVLVCTKEVFLNRYVKKHNDKELVAELMAIFTEKNK